MWIVAVAVGILNPSILSVDDKLCALFYAQLSTQLDSLGLRFSVD
jgi:hypothetical protein